LIVYDFIRPKVSSIPDSLSPKTIAFNFRNCIPYTYKCRDYPF